MRSALGVMWASAVSVFVNRWAVMFLAYSPRRRSGRARHRQRPAKPSGLPRGCFLQITTSAGDELRSPHVGSNLPLSRLPIIQTVAVFHCQTFGSFVFSPALLPLIAAEAACANSDALGVEPRGELDNPGRAGLRLRTFQAARLSR